MKLEDVAAKAARWWADQLRAGLPRLDNGDQSAHGAVTAVFAKLAQMATERKNPTTPAMIDAFEQALIELLLDGDEFEHEYTVAAAGTEPRKERRTVTLRGLRYEAARPDGSLCEPGCMGMFVGVDYHPDWWLQRAADRAGVVLETRLPLKTDMRIRFDGIEIKAGYGAGWQALP